MFLNLSCGTLYIVGSVKDSSITGWRTLVTKIGIDVSFGVPSISSEVLGSCSWAGFGWTGLGQKWSSLIRPKLDHVDLAEIGLEWLDWSGNWNGWTKVEFGMVSAVCSYVGALCLRKLGLSAIFFALKRASAFAIGLPTTAGVAAEENFLRGGVGVEGGG